MEDRLIRAVMALTHRLLGQARQDEGVRDDLRSLGEAILLATDQPSLLSTPKPSGQPGHGESAGQEPPEPPSTVEAEPEAVTGVVPEVAAPVPPLPELTLGRSRPYEPETRPYSPASTRKVTTTDAELPELEARCRLKAEAIRWAATRRRMKDQGANHRSEIGPRDRDFHDRAKKIGCYLWMSLPEFTVPEELARLEDVAVCFNLVADAVALFRGMLADLEASRPFFEPAMNALAEAQSALRVAIGRVRGPHDQDQFRAYDWLRGLAHREQIYIHQHITLDDPADPARGPKIGAKIRELSTNLEEIHRRAKSRRKALKRLEYQAGLIGKGQASEHNWQGVAGAVQDLIAQGLPVSSLEIREVLLPILDRMPELDGLPKEFALVLREIDRYLDGLTPNHEVSADDPTTPEVAEVARLLKGKSILIVGGIRRPSAHEALRDAFGLREIVWFETRDHEPVGRFEPYVARTEVALVLLPIRWSSHSFEGVKEFCNRYGKPMVRLLGGYNPNQFAAQVLVQCSRRLERKEDSPGTEAA